MLLIKRCAHKKYHSIYLSKREFEKGLNCLGITPRVYKVPPWTSSPLKVKDSFCCVVRPYDLINKYHHLREGEKEKEKEREIERRRERERPKEREIGRQRESQSG